MLPVDQNDLYAQLLMKGNQVIEHQLYNGEYSIQQIRLKGLRNDSLTFRNTAVGEHTLSPEAIALLNKRGLTTDTALAASATVRSGLDGPHFNSVNVRVEKGPYSF